MKKFTMLTIFASLLLLVIMTISATVLAEQSGSSPESGITSRIKATYDSLVLLDHGSDATGGWGDWGSMWNRIRSAGEWLPEGDASEADVASGKTFYGSDRTQLTGTAPASFDYSTQKLATKDDYLGTYTDEESVWVDVSGSPFAGFGDLDLASGQVKQDTRTGLWWSASSTTTLTNEFTLVDDGLRPTGGQAIGFCDDLNTASYGGSTDWYLPTQKELMMAYINGIYSQDPDFATTSYHWSSTEYSDDSFYAWLVYLPFGTTDSVYKGIGSSVRCVRRD